MKKTLLILTSVILALILSAITYFYIWGGKPYIKNFVSWSIAMIAIEQINEINMFLSN